MRYINLFIYKLIETSIIRLHLWYQVYFHSLHSLDVSTCQIPRCLFIISVEPLVICTWRLGSPWWMASKVVWSSCLDPNDPFGSSIECCWYDYMCTNQKYMVKYVVYNVMKMIQHIIKSNRMHTYSHIHIFTYSHIHIIIIIITINHYHYHYHYHYHSTYIHTYIHTHTYTYIHIHTHTYTYIHIHTHTYTYIHIHTHTYTYIHIHTHTHTHTYIHSYIHTFIHSYIHTFIHSYIHSYIHTYIHTYICMQTCMYICTALGIACRLNSFTVFFGPEAGLCVSQLACGSARSAQWCMAFSDGYEIVQIHLHTCFSKGAGSSVFFWETSHAYFSRAACA